MSQEKYIGMDVHQATISVAVMDAGGKLIMECLLKTGAQYGECFSSARKAGYAAKQLWVGAFLRASLINLVGF